MIDIDYYRNARPDDVLRAEKERALETLSKVHPRWCKLYDIRLEGTVIKARKRLK